MLNWIKGYFSDYETTMFYLMVILYALAMVASTLYPYARLPWDRSYKTTINEQPAKTTHDNKT